MQFNKHNRATENNMATLLGEKMFTNCSLSRMGQYTIKQCFTEFSNSYYIVIQPFRYRNLLLINNGLLRNSILSPLAFQYMSGC